MTYYNFICKSCYKKYFIFNYKSCNNCNNEIQLKNCIICHEEAYYDICEFHFLNKESKREKYR